MDRPQLVPRLGMLVVLVAVALSFWRGWGNSYGPKVENGTLEVYYKDGATREEADRLLAHFLKDLPASPDRRSLQLVRKESGYQVRMVVKPEFRTDEKVIEGLAFDGGRMARDVFGGTPVEVDVCDESFQSVRIIPLRPDLRHGLVVGKVEVFFPDGVDREDANRLGRFLGKELEGTSNPDIAAKLARQNDTFVVSLIFDPQVLAAPDFLPAMEADRLAMSRDAFGGRPVELHLCDDTFRVLKVLK